MTISSQTRTAGPFTGTGLIVPYPFGFKVFTTADVLATVTDAVGNVTTWALGGNYTIALNADQNAAPGGTLTPLAALPAGSSLILTTNISVTQNASLTNAGGFFPKTIEDALDRLTILLQQAFSFIGGAVRVPESTGLSILPAAAQRAGLLLGFDGAGGIALIAAAAQSASALALSLLSNTGSTFVNFLQAATGAVLRPLSDKLQDEKSVFDFMTAAQIADVRANTHLLDVTAAWQTAINWCAPRGIRIKAPAGTHSLLPGTSQVGAATFNTALVLLSGLHVVGELGTVFRIADNYSTDASPKEFSTFCTTVAISGVTFDTVVFDQNGANNKMSPARPVTYNSFNHFAIVGNGDTGGISKLKLINVYGQNCAGQCYFSQSFVANNHVTALPSGFQMIGGGFNNSGLDTHDHSSIYSWGTDCLFDGILFTNPTPPWTVGLTGPKTCIEVHGSNQTVVNCSNTLNSYALGLYIAPNFTAVTSGTVTHSCKWRTTDYGILIWRAVGALAYAGVDGVTIGPANYFSLDDYQHASPPSYKAMIAYQGEISTVQGGVKNIRILDNQYASTSTTLTTSFVKWNMTSQAGEDCIGLTIKGNEGTGVCYGIDLLTNAASALCALTTGGNKFRECTPDLAGNQPKGINVSGAGTIKTWTCDTNEFVDERATPLMSYAMYLGGSTITHFALANQVCKGMALANVRNAGATITNMIGSASSKGFANVADGGTINYVGDFVGFAPRFISLQETVTGERATPGVPGATTFTVAIKKTATGAAGTLQLLYWTTAF
jgi:hypothetical protein